MEEKKKVKKNTGKVNRVKVDGWGRWCRLQTSYSKTLNPKRENINIDYLSCFNFNVFDVINSHLKNKCTFGHNNTHMSMQTQKAHIFININP